MVRIFALGLLIAGITPTALANSSRADIKEASIVSDSKLSSSLSCKQLGLLSCTNTKKAVQLGVNGDLWIRDLAESILPNSASLICGRQDRGIPPTPKVLQNIDKKNPPWKTNLSLSSLGAIANSTCGFTWQQQLRQQVALEPKKADSNTLELNSVQNYKTIPKFPQLSRSSLIVDFPQENSTFIPRDTKLANPAPATERIASPFGWRNRPYSNQRQFHQGIDYGAPYGSTVVSVGNGIVTRVVSGCADFGSLFCGGQLGNWIEVDHGNGIIGTYGHLKHSSIAVQSGMRVNKNQPIAQVGSSGWSTGAHLDFRLKVNGKHENPAKYVMAIDSERAKQKPLE